MKSVKCPECKSDIKIKNNGHGRCKTCNAHVTIIDYMSASERDDNEMW